MLDLRLVDPGDRVAVISPSAGLPAVFPAVFELGLERIRNVLQLEPVEYPTTRVMGASLAARADDVMAAFADPTIAAVFSSIGGEDQIQLLKHLRSDVFVNNPKPFFGYSDNTHLHNYLWQLGIRSFYGCAVMTQLGMNGQMFDMTVDSLRQALFTRGEVELRPSPVYNDVGLDWSDESLLSQSRLIEDNDGWYWDGDQASDGKLWGGCVESMVPLLGSERWAPAEDAIDGTVLFLETAEDIPDPWIVQYVLIALGERGWLERMNGLLMGRPKAWEFDKPNSTEVKAAYRAEQRRVVVEIVRQYNPTMAIVQNLDFGHTDPQVLLPSGGRVQIQPEEQRVVVDYGRPRAQD